MNGFDRLPPQDIDAERSVLGAVLLNAEALDYAVEVLGVGGNVWYVKAHQELWGAMLALGDKGTPIDIVTLKQSLGDDGVARVGGLTYIAELTSAVPTSANVEHYAQIVKNCATLRALASAGQRIYQHAFDHDTKPQQLLDEAEKMFFGIFEDQERVDMVSLDSVVDDVLADLDQLSKMNGAPRGVPSGIKDLDAILGGWQNNSLIVLAARPSVGKTALALFCSEYAAKQNHPVMFFSLEMCLEELVQRLLCINSGADMGRIQQGFLASDEVQKLRNAGQSVKGLPISIDDKAHQSIWDVRSKARRWRKRERTPGLVVIDYMQLMSSPGRQQRYIEVGEMSRGLKALAKELRCPVITLSQLGREADGQIPRLSHLRESGNIEQDADVVVFLHPLDKEAQERVRREEHLEPGNTLCVVAKHRQGRRGHFYLNFDKPKQRFLPPVPGVPVDDTRESERAEEQEEMF